MILTNFPRKHESINISSEKDLEMIEFYKNVKKKFSTFYWVFNYFLVFFENTEVPWLVLEIYHPMLQKIYKVLCNGHLGLRAPDI